MACACQRGAGFSGRSPAETKPLFAASPLAIGHHPLAAGAAGEGVGLAVRVGVGVLVVVGGGVGEAVGTVGVPVGAAIVLDGVAGAGDGGVKVWLGSCVGVGLDPPLAASVGEGRSSVADSVAPAEAPACDDNGAATAIPIGVKAVFAAAGMVEVTA